MRERETYGTPNGRSVPGVSITSTENDNPDSVKIVQPH